MKPRTMPEDAGAAWEAIKKSEKNRSSVTEGIPAALPALSLAAKLQRKALAVGMELPGVAEEAVRITAAVSALGTADPGPAPVAADRPRRRFRRAPLRAGRTWPGRSESNPRRHSG